jgi:hypothetical protein
MSGRLPTRIKQSNANSSLMARFLRKLGVIY